MDKQVKLVALQAADAGSYPAGSTRSYKEDNRVAISTLATFPCLLQDDFGEDNDCTLTSITAILCYYKPNADVAATYATVEEVARKYGYTGTKGTNPLVIRSVFTKAWQKVLFDDRSRIKSKYLKGVCWDFVTIKELIDEGTPAILSFWKAGKYKNHSVTVIGYNTTGEKILIADNWSATPQWIAVKDVSFISSLVFPA